MSVPRALRTLIGRSLFKAIRRRRLKFSARVCSVIVLPVPSVGRHYYPSR